MGNEPKTPEQMTGELIERTKMRESGAAGNFDLSRLFCYGCAHSAASQPFPGRPSGERPCMFCIRNPGRERAQQEFEARDGRRLLEWYDGSPIAFYPMDAYMTLDMNEQVDRWERKAKGEPDWNEPRGGVRFG